VCPAISGAHALRETRNERPAITVPGDGPGHEPQPGKRQSFEVRKARRPRVESKKTAVQRETGVDAGRGSVEELLSLMGKPPDLARGETLRTSAVLERRACEADAQRRGASEPHSPCHLGFHRYRAAPADSQPRHKLLETRENGPQRGSIIRVCSVEPPLPRTAVLQCDPEARREREPDRRMTVDG
jgi:hypothetical protein